MDNWLAACHLHFDMPRAPFRLRDVRNIWGMAWQQYERLKVLATAGVKFFSMSATQCKLIGYFPNSTIPGAFEDALYCEHWREIRLFLLALAHH